MGSYTLHVAIMAIASITLLQEVNCDGSSSQSCGDFRPKIWNKAFSKKGSMNFIDSVFKTAEKLATDEVCSDTYRSLFKFIEMLATNESAHFMILMFDDLMLAIMQEAGKDMVNFKELLTVLERIFTDEKVSDFVVFYLTEWLNLISIPENRSKLFRMVKSLEYLSRPTEAEVEVKDTLNKLKSLVSLKK